MVVVAKYEIRYNRKSKRYIVFEVPKKGRWKIKKNVKTRKEAQDWIGNKTKKKKRKQRR